MSTIQPHTLYTNYEDPKELYYICSVKNLASILKHGLLSHVRAHRNQRLTSDVSDPDVQTTRANKYPDNSEREKSSKKCLQLHQYVNLYLQPYNRTLYRFLTDEPNLCILRVHPKLLMKKEVLISSANAACNIAEFKQATAHIFDHQSSKVLHAYKSKMNNYYRNQQGITHDEETANQIRQAEVLVPYKVPPSYIKGIFVPDNNVKKVVETIFKRSEKVTVHPSLFYKDGKDWHQLEPLSSPEISDTDVHSYEATSSGEENKLEMDWEDSNGTFGL